MVEELSLPEILSIGKGRNNNKLKSPQKKRDVSSESLMIYKDFDTSLTAVKGNIKKLPVLHQTTAQRGEDLIRDRLLSFNMRKGQMSSIEIVGNKKAPTMIERSAALH